MSSKQYYRQYNQSPRGRARMARFLATPRRKIYQALWAEQHKDRIKLYASRYKVKRRHWPAVVVQCQTYKCTGTFTRKGYRKFCDECRQVFGYHIKSRWYFRRKARLEEERRTAA